MPHTRAPWHHWPVAILALLFYLMGSLDFAFTRLHLGFYTGGFKTEQLDFFDGMEFWLTILWALGTLGGLFGAWLLLRRNRYSVLILFVAFAALVILTLWLTMVSRPSLMEMTGLLGLYLMTTSSALAFLFYLYARWERTHKALD